MRCSAVLLSSGRATLLPFLLPRAASRRPPTRPPSPLPRCSIGRRDERDDLSYPEWVELLGMIAHTLGEGRLMGNRNDLVTSLGVSAGDEGAEGEEGPRGRPQRRGMGMLLKLQLLFCNMYDLGAKFEGEAQRMVRAIAAAVRKEVAAAKAEAASATQAAELGGSRRVQDMLSESVYV